MNKEEKELKKLDLEIKELQRPWFVRPANLVSILSLVFAIYQYQSAEIKKTEAKTVFKEAEEQKIFLDDKQQKVLAAEKGLLEKIDRPTVSTGRIMDVWAYGVDESLVQDVREYLIKEGNTVGFGGLLSYRPSWLALKPTVFYYDKNAKDIAKQIANEIQSKTGISFDVSWGAGLGVNKEEKDRTFFVHLVK